MESVLKRSIVRSRTIGGIRTQVGQRVSGLGSLFCAKKGIATEIVTFCRDSLIGRWSILGGEDRFSVEGKGVVWIAGGAEA